MNRITMNELRMMLAKDTIITCTYTCPDGYSYAEDTFIVSDVLFGCSAFADLQIRFGTVTPNSVGVLVDLTPTMPHHVFKAWQEYQYDCLYGDKEGDTND